MDFSPEFWEALYKVAGGGLIGGIVTAFSLVFVAKTKSKTESRKNDQSFQVNMNAEQRQWFESLKSQLDAQVSRTDALQMSLQSQRDYYENIIGTVRSEYIGKIEEQETLYAKKLLEQENHCQEQIAMLHKRLEASEGQIATLLNQRRKLFQELNGGACVSQEPPGEK